MKKRKKVLAGILSILLVILCTMGLSACDGMDFCFHEWGEWSVITEATCTQEGVKVSTCRRCGNTKSKAIEPTGHVPNEDDGDCTTAITCSVCGEVITPGNDAHTGGTATCQHRAVCTECGTEYGDYAAHEGELIWIKHIDSHYQVYSCCYQQATEPEAHTIEDGVCTVCGYRPTITVPSAETEPGGQVKLALSLEDNPGITGLMITIQFSDSFLLSDAESGEALDKLTFTKPSSLSSGCTFLWDAETVTDKDIKCGEFLILTFDVSETAPPGKYNIILTVKAYDNNLQPVSLNISSGIIAVN